MLAEIMLVFVGLLIGYIAYLHLQLHISRRIISALQETTVTAETAGRFNVKPVLALFGVLILVAGAVASWAR